MVFDMEELEDCVADRVSRRARGESVGESRSLFLQALFLVLFSSFVSFLLGHWLLFSAFSHTQSDHRIPIVEVDNEAFG